MLWNVTLFQSADMCWAINKLLFTPIKRQATVHYCVMGYLRTRRSLASKNSLKKINSIESKMLNNSKTVLSFISYWESKV